MVRLDRPVFLAVPSRMVGAASRLHGPLTKDLSYTKMAATPFKLLRILLFSTIASLGRAATRRNP